MAHVVVAVAIGFHTLHIVASYSDVLLADSANEFHNGSLECSGDGDCKIVCSEFMSCYEAQMQCPEHFRCDIECSGADACRASTVQCPYGNTCTVSCSNDNACRQMSIEASYASEFHLRDCAIDNLACNGISIAVPPSRGSSPRAFITDQLSSTHDEWLHFYAIFGWHDIEFQSSIDDSNNDDNEVQGVMHCLPHYDASCTFGSAWPWACDDADDVCNTPPTPAPTISPTTMATNTILLQSTVSPTIQDVKQVNGFSADVWDVSTRDAQAGMLWILSAVLLSVLCFVVITLAYCVLHSRWNSKQQQQQRPSSNSGTSASNGSVRGARNSRTRFHSLSDLRKSLSPKFSSARRSSRSRSTKPRHEKSGSRRNSSRYSFLGNGAETRPGAVHTAQQMDTHARYSSNLQNAPVYHHHENDDIEEEEQEQQEEKGGVDHDDEDTMIPIPPAQFLDAADTIVVVDDDDDDDDRKQENDDDDDDDANTNVSAVPGPAATPTEMDDAYHIDTRFDAHGDPKQEGATPFTHTTTTHVRNQSSVPSLHINVNLESVETVHIAPTEIDDDVDIGNIDDDDDIDDEDEDEAQDEIAPFLSISRRGHGGHAYRRPALPLQHMHRPVHAHGQNHMEFDEVPQPPHIHAHPHQLSYPARSLSHVANTSNWQRLQHAQHLQHMQQKMRSFSHSYWNARTQSAPQTIHVNDNAHQPPPPSRPRYQRLESASSACASSFSSLAMQPTQDMADVVVGEREYSATSGAASTATAHSNIIAYGPHTLLQTQNATPPSNALYRQFQQRRFLQLQALESNRSGSSSSRGDVGFANDPQTMDMDTYKPVQSTMDDAHHNHHQPKYKSNAMRKSKSHTPGPQARSRQGPPDDPLPLRQSYQTQRQSQHLEFYDARDFRELQSAHRMHLMMRRHAISAPTEIAVQQTTTTMTTQTHSDTETESCPPHDIDDVIATTNGRHRHGDGDGDGRIETSASSESETRFDDAQQVAAAADDDDEQEEAGSQSGSASNSGAQSRSHSQSRSRSHSLETHSLSQSQSQTRDTRDEQKEWFDGHPPHHMDASQCKRMLGHNPSDTIEFDDADMYGDHHRRVTTLVNSNDTLDSLSANSVHQKRIKIGGGDDHDDDDKQMLFVQMQKRKPAMSMTSAAVYHHSHPHPSKHPRSDVFEAAVFASSVSKMMSPIKSPIYNDDDEEDDDEAGYRTHKPRNSTLEIHGLINM